MLTPEILALYGLRIGTKLRRLRAQKQLTLRRAAAEAGLSASLLSKHESDHTIPTLQTLSKLCIFYGVPLSHFFDGPVRHSLSITRKGCVEAISGSPSGRQIPIYEDLIGSKWGAKVIEIPLQRKVSASEPGKIFSGLVYVIEGKLALHIGTSREVLHPGDFACIDTDMSVEWQGGSKIPCRFLSVRISDPKPNFCVPKRQNQRHPLEDSARPLFDRDRPLDSDKRDRSLLRYRENEFLGYWPTS